MNIFEYHGNNLFCEEVDLAIAARDTGTPCYVYSNQAIVSQVRAFDTALDDVPHLICYSLKANSNLAICRILAEEGMGADTVSGGEIYKALNAGIAPKKIVFSGVGKADYDLRLALRNEILSINVESLEELAVVNEMAGQMRKVAAIAFRVNPDIDAQTHPYISTGLKDNKFGIDYDEALAAYQHARTLPNVKIVGLAYHIGSQITEMEPFLASARKAADLVRELSRTGIVLNFVDIGGGLGITYKDEQPPAPAVIRDQLVPILKATHCKIICEPGRFIVGNSGVLLTRVLYVKRKSGKTFVVVDAGMNDLIRPALYEAYHNILPVTRRGGAVETVDVVGPICESSDCFAHGRSLELPQRDDVLAIMSAGAYGYSMCSNYNCRLKPAEALVHKGRCFTIRTREVLTDLIDNDESWMIRLFD